MALLTGDRGVAPGQRVSGLCVIEPTGDLEGVHGVTRNARLVGELTPVYVGVAGDAHRAEAEVRSLRVAAPAGESRRIENALRFVAAGACRLWLSPTR